MFLRGKRLEAAEIRGCLALEKLTGLPGERRASRGVTCRILRASRPSISPLTGSRFFFLFVQWFSMFPSFLVLSILSSSIHHSVKYSKNVDVWNNYHRRVSFRSTRIDSIWKNFRKNSILRSRIVFLPSRKILTKIFPKFTIQFSL